MAKILVTGANGQLGNEMRCLAEEDKKNTFLYQSDIIEDIYFFEDYIEIYNLCNHSHMQYHYSEFSFVAHTTHLIVLANTQTHLLINKNGFYKGTLIDFLNFISMKRGKNCNEFKYFI